MLHPKVIDARGLECPKPLMITRAELMALQEGDIFEIWLDNETSCQNVCRMLEQLGLSVEKTIRDGLQIVCGEVSPRSFAPGIASRGDFNEAQVEVCPTADQRLSQGFDSGYVVVLAQDTMGQGDDELGRILVQGALNALPEVQPSPAKILFYNSGVKLACEGSLVLSGLEKLAERGASLLVCGTCLSYFELKEKLKVGRISNMLEILECLAAAKKILRI